MRSDTPTGPYVGPAVWSGPLEIDNRASTAQSRLRNSKFECCWVGGSSQNGLNRSGLSQPQCSCETGPSTAPLKLISLLQTFKFLKVSCLGCTGFAGTPKDVLPLTLQLIHFKNADSRWKVAKVRVVNWLPLPLPAPFTLRPHKG
jgi:hypothetical protein